MCLWRRIANLGRPRVTIQIESSFRYHHSSLPSPGFTSLTYKLSSHLSSTARFEKLYD